MTMEDRYLQTKRQGSYTGLVKLVALSSILNELKDKQQSKHANIQTSEEFQFYLMLMGAYGRLGKLAAWYTIMRYPELAIYVSNEESVARQQKAKPLAETSRDQSGFVEQIVPQINSTNSSFEKESYRSKPYSYKGYSPKAYLKSTLEKGKGFYSGLSKKVREAFGKIRSIYQSASGVIRSRKHYEGRNEAPRDNVVILDAYRQATEKIKYNLPQIDSLEKRLAA